MSVLFDIDFLAKLATVVVGIMIFLELRQSDRQARDSFEEQLDQQYRQIAMDLPVNVIIGLEWTPEEIARSYEIREITFNYFDLCNEQLHLRSKGKVSDDTFNSWKSGMRQILKQDWFVKIHQEVSDKAGFTYLNRFVESNYEEDPKPPLFKRIFCYFANKKLN